MNRLPVKIMSVAMAASMMLSVAACSKGSGNSSGGGIFGGGNSGSGSNASSRSGEKITKDMPWFESKVIEPDNVIDSGKPVEYTYSRLAGSDKDNILILTTGYYKMPEMSDAEWETFDYSKYAINVISVIDRASNNIVKSIDLNDNISGNEYIESSELVDGKLAVRVCTWNDLTYEQSYKQKIFDISSGELLETKDMPDVEGNMEKTFRFGDYTVETEMNWDESDSAWYNLYVTSPDGNTTKVELKERGTDYYDIPVVLAIDENTALVPVSTNGGYIYFELDLKEAKVTSADAKKYDWLDLDMCYSTYSDPDGNVYFTSSTGIMKIDFKNKQMEEFLNFSWSDVNRHIVSYLEIADISDDKVLLCGENYDMEMYSDENTSKFVIVEFTKAAANPHAGKTILELYSPYGYTEDKIGDAILKYNQTSTDYFIEVTDRYTSLDDTDYSNIYTEDESDNASLNADSKMSNQLAMDILNGDGPDLLMNVSYYGQLNNPNYLTDLTPYIGSLDSNKYFTNVIDAGKTDGKLYNLPVCFQVEGIQTAREYAGASGVGFTTEEYEKFLKDTLNGKDVITSGQAYYFAKLFTYMSDKFIVDGKVDFSGPEFAALAEFVKENVVENSKPWDEYSDDDYVYASGAYGVGASIVKGDRGFGSNDKAFYTNCYGISNYLTLMTDLHGADAILGLPSADGRGPMVKPYISIAISAQAYNVDACGEFIKLLMSDEVQLDFAMKDYFVLSRDAFRTAGMKAIDYFNGGGYASYYGLDPNSPEVKNRALFSEKNLDDMEAIIESCSIMCATDADISLILVEEMPAYFSGQKDLDSVIAIAQERCQKVINERG